MLLALAISLFSRFPAYADRDTRFPGNVIQFPTTPTGQAIAWWLNHPLQAVPIATFFPPEKTAADAMLAGSASHADKLTFRAFLPFVNRLVHSDGAWTLVLANHLAAILLPFLIYRLCLRTTGDAVVATTATWAYAATWAGTWGFNDVMFGDAVALALLLGAMATTRPWLIALLVFAASFTDERAAVAAPLVALFQYWRASVPTSVGAESDRSTAAGWLAPFGGVIGYLACRCALTWTQNLHAGTSMMGTLDIFLYHFYASYPAKLFKVFEFLWLMPILLFSGLWTARRRSALLYFAGMLLAAAPAFVVWDVDRSLCYLLPGIVAAVCFAPVPSPAKSRLTLALAAASLLWIEPNLSVLRYFVFR